MTRLAVTKEEHETFRTTGVLPKRHYGIPPGAYELEIRAMRYFGHGLWRSVTRQGQMTRRCLNLWRLTLELETDDYAVGAEASVHASYLGWSLRVRMRNRRWRTRRKS